MGLSHDEWPLWLIYLTEVTFVLVVTVCILLAVSLRRTGAPLNRDIAGHQDSGSDVRLWHLADIGGRGISAPRHSSVGRKFLL